MSKEEMMRLIEQINQKTNTVVEFTIQGPLGETKRIAKDYISGKAIIEAWEKEIKEIEVK